MTIDQQFIEYVVKQIVDDPDSVTVERTVDDKGVLLRLFVSEDDIGRVIGKRGSTAQSLRTLLRALGTKNEARYNLKIVDPEKDDQPAPVNDDESTAESQAASDSEADSPDATDEPEVVTVEETIEVEEEVQEPPQQSDMAAKTRQELAGLDDLDI